MFIEHAFDNSGENHGDNPEFGEYVNNLNHEDENYFTVDELRFPLKI